MSNIHPDWQAEDEMPIQVSVKNTPPAQKQISRRPAAIVGMLLVLGAGFSFFRGTELLTGQLADTIENTITITDDGFLPDSLEVTSGDTITWNNEQDTPHILESDSLCRENGECLLTSTLFKGDSDTFTITPDIPAGTYQYHSSIVGDLIGEIVITSDATFITTDEYFQDALDTPSTPTPTPTPVAAEAIPDSPSPLPSNPYAIGNDRMHPFDNLGNPIPEAFDDDAYSTPEPVRYTNGKGPVRQPESGADVWVILIGSIAGLWYVTRSAFARQT